MRSFIAIRIQTTEEMESFFHSLKDNLSDERIKWVDFNHLHLTLFFMGDQQEDLIERVGEELENSLSNVNSFNIELKGCGVFPSLKRPGVIWMGIAGSEKLLAVKELVNEIMKKNGLEPDSKSFKPHITLGRVKYINDLKKLRTIMAEHQDHYFQKETVDKIILFESILKQDGPTYKIVKEIALN